MTARRAHVVPDPRRGEIWRVALDPTVGSEIQKTRPCLVVGTDALARLPIRIVVPLTTWREKHEMRPWCAKVDADRQNGLQAASAADAIQVRCVSTYRFRERLGTDAPGVLSQVLAAVALCLDLSGLEHP